MLSGAKAGDRVCAPEKRKPHMQALWEDPGTKMWERYAAGVLESWITQPESEDWFQHQGSAAIARYLPLNLDDRAWGLQVYYG